MYLYRKFTFSYATERAIWSSNRWNHHPLIRISNHNRWKHIKILSERSCDEIWMEGKAYLYCVSRYNFRIQHGFTWISLQNHWIFYRKPLSTVVDLVIFWISISTRSIDRPCTPFKFHHMIDLIGFLCVSNNYDYLCGLMDDDSNDLMIKSLVL